MKSSTQALGEWIAPDFSLPGVDGTTYSVSSFDEYIGLVIIFTCNHCPYAKHTWPTFIDLAKTYASKQIGFVAISANDATSYPQDSFENMKVLADTMDVPFPYLYDETQEVARAYDAKCTPDIYMFDHERALYYRGRVNDARPGAEAATTHDLEDAITSLIQKQSPPQNQIPSMGCSIKWK